MISSNATCESPSGIIQELFYSSALKKGDKPGPVTGRTANNWYCDHDAINWKRNETLKKSEVLHI